MKLEKINETTTKMVDDNNDNNSVESQQLNTNNIMDVYLKKHSLDLIVIPNRNMIKLSDLRPKIGTMESTSILNETNSGVSSSNEDEEEDEDEEEEEDADSSACELINGKKMGRKKREPSLKLQQKLTNQDLELIVNSVRNQQARVFIADVNKIGYVDKILRIELGQDVKLSNGRNEALLKKSMFPKELTTLFDAFVESLCGQVSVRDERGVLKPILKCLVESCGFKSISEAEIHRHIKRHLAQDGFTCDICGHQFASMTNLQRHVRIHKSAADKNGVGGLKTVKCPECSYQAATITHVKRHMAHKHLERSLPCPHCSFMGATNAELKIHIARKHLELTGKNPLFLPKYLRKDYQCGVCNLQFNDFKVNLRA